MAKSTVAGDSAGFGRIWRKKPAILGRNGGKWINGFRRPRTSIIVARTWFMVMTSGPPTSKVPVGAAVQDRPGRRLRHIVHEHRLKQLRSGPDHRHEGEQAVKGHELVQPRILGPEDP